MNVRLIGVATSYLQLGGPLTGRIIPVSKLFGSPPFISHFHGHLVSGSHNPILRGVTITMVFLAILLVGMICQVLRPIPKTTCGFSLAKEKADEFHPSYLSVALDQVGVDVALPHLFGQLQTLYTNENMVAQKMDPRVSHHFSGSSC